MQWSARAEVNEGLIYAVGRDVTERRRADEQLRDAQRMIAASHEELRVLAEEQASLSRVATLVARGASPDEVFQAVCDEVAELLDAGAARLLRYEFDGTGTIVAATGRPGMTMRTGARISLGG